MIFGINYSVKECRYETFDKKLLVYNYFKSKKVKDSQHVTLNLILRQNQWQMDQTITLKLPSRYYSP
jgi:hypothetical protein